MNLSSNVGRTLVVLAAVFLAASAIVADTPSETVDKVVGRAGQSPLGYDGSLLVQLRVTDLDRAVTFYRDVMNFELVHRNDSLSWAKLSPGIPGVRIGLGVGREVKGSGNLSLNFGVRDIESARKQLEKRGVTFQGPTITIPQVVKLADFTDPDGNRIRLAEDLAPRAGEQ